LTHLRRKAARRGHDVATLAALSLAILTAWPPPGAAAGASSPAGGRASSAEAASLNAQAVDEYNRGEYEEAIALFDEALDLDPENEVVLANLALSHYTLGLALCDAAGHPHFDEDALFHFKEATGLDPERSAYHAALGKVYLLGGRLDDAERCLERARRLDPEDAEVLSLLAELRYRRGDLDGAEERWEQAKRIDPGSGPTDETLERMRRERDLERNFGRREHQHFSVRFDADPQGIRSRVEEMLRVLEDAYRSVGRDYEIRPTYEIPVVIYQEDDFRSITGVHDWARGVYDGKIRVPVSALDRSDEEMRRILRHEYMHAAVHFVTGGRCTAWLDEGLAQWEAGEWSEDRARALEEIVQRKELPPLESLEGSFIDEKDGDLVRIHYAESAAAVRFLHHRYGRWSITRLLRSLGKGRSFPDALEEVFGLSYQDLDRELARRIGWGDLRSTP
jgi:tetratricopeptide (TPR) repeat protein